ncbi:MAG: hypothetical protein IJP54_01140 [Synergistaceae bacterium]|nr:hypothetical protein [Synergistaceae bacterium]MBR0034256.1 hypothetical protein [Synergistaceae bacterium]
MERRKEDKITIYTAILTALIETPIFYFAGYSDFTDCCCFVCINLISNTLLNQRLAESVFSWPLLFLYELGVVILEFAMSCCIMRSIHRFSLRKLLLVLFITNTVSFLAGLLYILLLI